ncbi:sensor histidine kinase [Vallitalea okinawensis]|uniref:sensor histidine kinase n=1 Tax=Vallitalea okinawensis TaxID=2078660 RepID=UPI000CFA8A8B|nr:sensor histidine kinase [Vallitalea okinawensis]
MKKRLYNLWRYWDKLKLKHRLILLNFTIIILITSIITVIMLNYSKKIISENSTVLIQDSINQINRSIDEMLKEQLYAVSEFIINDDDINEYLSRYNKEQYIGNRQKEVDTFLIRKKLSEQYFIYQEHINLAAIINDDGEVYNLSYPVNEDSIVQNYIDNLIRKAEISKDLTVKWYPLTDNIFTEKDAGQSRINNVVIARRNMIRATSGKYIGEQIYTISEKAIYEKYSDSELIKEGIVFIIDRNGHLVSHSQLEMIESKNLENHSTIIHEVLNNPENSYFISSDNKLVIHESLNEKNWITIAVMPTNIIYKDISRIYFLFILLIVILLLIAGISITMISDRIVQPIKRIIRSMEEVEKGNFNVSVNIKGQYEISKLAKYYNNMISKINQLIEEEYILEKKKKTAELDALMAQINPHFLYNTLESIVWKARSIGAEDISEMSYSLGKFFRISVNRGQIIVPVEEELNHVRAYVNIQKIRYGNKFDMTIHLEDEHIKAYKTLKLILQPIVENAIMYGIEPLEGVGYIKITVLEDVGHLLFIIEDNGKGMVKDRLDVVMNKLNTYKDMGNEEVDVKEMKRNGGIGLSNVCERIRLYFGEEYGIRIESTLNQGTVVTIKMPLME